MVPLTAAGGIAAVDVGAGVAHTCAVLASGAIRCWGRNMEGQLGLASAIDAVGDNETVWSVGYVTVPELVAPSCSPSVSPSVSPSASASLTIVLPTASVTATTSASGSVTATASASPSGSSEHLPTSRGQCAPRGKHPAASQVCIVVDN